MWIHCDLLRPNVLVRDGRIGAVIDFGGVGVGDPAADVIAAWAVFGRAGRDTFHDTLDVDDGTWERARGFALHQAAMIIPYYRETNPNFVALAKRTVEEILADADGQLLRRVIRASVGNVYGVLYETIPTQKGSTAHYWTSSGSPTCGSRAFRSSAATHYERMTPRRRSRPSPTRLLLWPWIPAPRFRGDKLRRNDA